MYLWFFNKLYDSSMLWSLTLKPLILDNHIFSGLFFNFIETIFRLLSRIFNKNKYFDVVVAGEVIEHLDNPYELIREMVRLAKNRIVLSTPK